MYNKKYTNNIINNIIQKTNKQHLICTIQIKNKQEILFLNYLWFNKIIYGYKVTGYQIYILYLKYRKNDTQIKYNKINKINCFKSLLKKRLWTKNNYYLIKTLKGFKNINETLTLKIGGYIIYSIL